MPAATEARLSDVQRKMVETLPDVQFKFDGCAADGYIVQERRGPVWEALRVYAYDFGSEAKLALYLQFDVPPEHLAMAVAECRQALSAARRRITRNLSKRQGRGWKAPFPATF